MVTKGRRRRRRRRPWPGRGGGVQQQPSARSSPVAHAGGGGTARSGAAPPGDTGHCPATSGGTPAAHPAGAASRPLPGASHGPSSSTASGSTSWGSRHSHATSAAVTAAGLFRPPSASRQAKRRSASSPCRPRAPAALRTSLRTSRLGSAACPSAARRWKAASGVAMRPPLAPSRRRRESTRSSSSVASGSTSYSETQPLSPGESASQTEVTLSKSPRHLQISARRANVSSRLPPTTARQPATVLPYAAANRCRQSRTFSVLGVLGRRSPSAQRPRRAARAAAAEPSPAPCAAARRRRNCSKKGSAARPAWKKDSSSSRSSHTWGVHGGTSTLTSTSTRRVQTRLRLGHRKRFRTPRTLNCRSTESSPSCSISQLPNTSDSLAKSSRCRWRRPPSAGP
mmetsp:Transcript_30707/g.82208  ORF Transcript_30707/g.82208 Transcript_30707/m.82208 type:complete len:398 (+) Transcript_30707:613-1806(+)